jgi:hypothetical protein
MTEHVTSPYGGTQPPRFDDPVDPTLGTPLDDGRPGSSTDAGTAKGEARRVADTATSAGAGVAQTAKEQAAGVAGEAKHQAASLLDTVRTEVGQQAGTQQQRIAEAVHSLSKELGSMASSSSEQGMITDLAQQASRRGGEIAHWLSDREPADVLEAVRSYARRRPGSFLLLCGLAGVVAGRITRSTVATRTSLDSPDGADGQRSLTDGGTVAPPAPIAYTPPPVEYAEETRAASTPPPSTGTIATGTTTVTAPSTTGGQGYGTSGSAAAPLTGTDPLAPGGDPTR